ncbi:Calx-beta domain-containing protein [Candidatus Poriferisocius sp.]|uniref:Calx-beta domain-containing protein n=1 Tax=Candidatus Poriferisocius sp. TaxID=3101276 RepID=UPI003B01ECA5
MPEEEQAQAEHREPGVRGGWGERGASPLELVLLAVPLVLLVVFVLWAGRGGRAGLVSDLAAGEAAVVASLCCEDGDDPAAAEERNQVVADVLSARPGLGFLCIGGPRPAALDDDEKFVDEAWLESFDPEVRGATRGVGAVGVRFECETDGAVAPLRGLFPTVSFFGQAAEVVAIPPRPILEVGESSEDEGDAGDPDAKKVKFLIEFTGPAAQNVNIVYWTADDPNPATHEATAGTDADSDGEVDGNGDYLAILEGSPQGITTIAEGQVSAVVQVTVKGDDAYEHDETFLLHWYMVPADPCDADVPQLSNPYVDPHNPDPGPACKLVGDELVTVGGYDPKRWWRAKPAVGTITNDDDPPTLVVDPASAEEGDPMTFDVRLQGSTEVEVEVTVETRDHGTGVGKAKSGVDYTPIDSTSPNRDITFPPGTTTQNVTVPTIENTTGEQDKTFELRATADDHARTNPPNIENGKHVAIGVGTIKDDEPKIRIEVGAGASVREGESLLVEVKLDRPPTDLVWVHYRVVPSGTHPATPPSMPNSDYTVGGLGPTGRLEFKVGDPTTQTISVSTRADAVDENDETFTVELENPSTNSLIVVSSVEVTILDQDNPPKLEIAGPANLVEEGQVAEFTATLIGATIFNVEFDVETRDGTGPNGAVQPGDYTQVPTTRITIPAGQSAIPILVQTSSDENEEVVEDFHLDVDVSTLHNADPARDPLTASASIRDATRRVVYVSNSPTEEEGEDLVFTITLDNRSLGPITEDVTINYEVVPCNTCPSSNPAIADVDYRRGNPHTPMGSVTFKPGEALTQNVEVETLLDRLVETDETLLLKLSSTNVRPPDGFKCEPCDGTGTITNFTLPELSVNNPSAKEGDDLGFTVTLSPASKSDTSFDVRTYALTASAGVGDCADGGDYLSDFESPSPGRRVTIDAGETTASIPIPTCSDADADFRETLQLRISDPDFASIDKGIGTGTIEDVLPMVLSVDNANAVAGDVMGFVVGLTRPAAANFTVYYSTKPYTGRPDIAMPSAKGDGGDYSNANEESRGDSARGEINFKAGELSMIAKVETWPDNELYEEVFQLNIELGEGAGQARVVLGKATAVGRITPRHSILDIANAEAVEGKDVEFIVTRRGRTDQRSTVNFSTSRLATAARPAKGGFERCTDCDYYTPSETQLVFAPDQTERTISVGTRVDTDDEWPFEQFLVRLHNPVNAGLGASAAVGTINEECADAADSSSKKPVATGKDQIVGEGAGRATVVFEFRPAVCPATPPPTVGYTIGAPGAGAAATVGADYTAASSGTARVEGYRVFIDVAVLDDALDEDDEALEVAITGWDSGQAARWTDADVQKKALLTIQDDDAEPEVSVYDSSAVEGGLVRFSVRLDRPSGRTVTVPYSTHPLTATEGVDYDAPTGGTLVFEAGDTEEFAAVVALTDTNSGEGDEQFQLRLGTPVNAGIDVGTAIGTIVDRTQPGLSITSNYETTGTKASEGGWEVFTVSLDEASTDEVSVEYATVGLSGDGAATAGTDFTAATGTITFAANDNTPQTFRVEILRDNVPEDDERLQARLLRPVNAVIGDGVAATVIAGQCADPANAAHPPPTLSVAGASIDEGHRTGTMAFALAVDRPLCSEAAISVSRTHITTSAADFAGNPAAAVFPAGVTSAVYQGIVVADDDLDEADETFGVAVSWAAGPQTWQDAAAATATGTIIDDDETAEISIAGASGIEGATLSFPVTLDRVAPGDVTVEYAAERHNAAAYPAEPGADFEEVSGTLTIAAGTISGAVEVPALRDDVDGEPDETFLVRLSRPNRYAQISVGTAAGTIIDVPTPKISVADAEADEGQILEFEVTLDTEGAEPVKVEFKTVELSGDGAATSGDDYLPTSGTLTFAPGETLKTVQVAALADNKHLEGDESLELKLSNPAGADLDDEIGVGVIRNLGEPEISVADSRAEEGQSVVFKITLNNRGSRDITVGYAAESRRTAGDVAATEGDDYNAVTGTATISAGDTEATVAVATVDDRVDEYDEVFALTLTLTAPDYGTLADANATGTIEDNDDEPAITIADTAEAEDAGTLDVTVALDAPSGRTVAVDYAFTAGTATEGTDYQAVTGGELAGTVAIPAGRRSAVLSVALIDDELAEGAETLTLSLSNPRNATLAASTATLTILDDEGLPTAYLDPDLTGSPEGQPTEIALRLSGPSEQEVTVDYRTSGGTATPGADYTAVPLTTATFAVGETLKTLSTPTVDDDDEEDDETVGWEISNPTNAQLAQTTGTSLIIDDDGEPRIRVDDARATEGGQAAFTIRLSAPSDEEVTVAYRTQADAFAGAAAATPDQDFTSTSGTATIAAGTQTATVPVTLPDDSLDEGIETFWLRLDADTASGADVADAVAIGTIDDNDPPPTLSIANAAAVEGDPVQFAVTLSAPSGRTVKVRYAPQRHDKGDPDREATPVDDYDPAAKVLVIPAGTTTAVAEVQAREDQITEYRETFLVRLYNPDHATIAVATATGTIIDKTGLPQASIANAQTAEGNGTISVPVTLSHASAQTVTFAYTTQTTATDEEGHAKPGDDYTTASGTLTIDPGETTATIDVAIADDDTVEPDETFAIQLRNPQQATLIEDRATATIIDDDGLPRLSITSAQAAEDDGSITLNVALSHPSTDPVTVQYNTFDNTATQRRDYTPTTGTLTIDAGNTAATISVPITDDLIDENPETITVRLTNPTKATVLRTAAAATATIQDDDPAPTIRLLPATAEEGQPLQFTALLDAPSGLTVDTDYTTQTTGTGAGHATPNADYTPTRGTITIPPGETTATISVATLTDTRTEIPETLQLALTNPQNTTLHPTGHTAVGTINNNPPPTITVNDASALEGSPVRFTLQLDKPATSDVEVEFHFISVTASGARPGIRPSDRRYFQFFPNYPSTPPPPRDPPYPLWAVIPAGQTQTTVTVPTGPALGATLGDLTFLLRLVRVTEGFAVIGDATAVGTILQTALAPSLSVDDPQAAEGAAATFTVTLTRDENTADTAVSVAYRTEALTAAEGTDYTAATGRLSFPASENTQELTVSVPTVDDKLSEDPETFQLVLHSLQGKAQITDRAGTATILDNDSEPTLSIGAAEADEGTPLEFAATLNSPSGRRITADYRTRGVTAADGVDYLTTAGTVTFPPGTTRQTITVATLPDSLVEDDETLEVVLSNFVGAVPGGNGAGTIIDATNPAIRVADASAQEGDPLEFVVTLNRQHDTAVTVAYATAGSGANPATANSDYTPATGTVAFPPGTTRQTVSVATLTDQNDENDETLTLTLSNPTGTARILDGTATGTIQNAALPTISVQDATGRERGLRGPATYIALTVSLSYPTSQIVTVDWATADGTATGAESLPEPRSLAYPIPEGWNEVDYKEDSGTVTFPAGTTTRTIRIEIARDAAQEFTETFHVEFSNPVNAIVDPDPLRATVTIIDANHAMRIRFGLYGSAQYSFYEGAAARSRPTADVYFSWEGWHVSTDMVITADYSIEELPASDAANRATAGEDFVAETGTLTINPGQQYASIPLRILDDSNFEGTEQFQVTLSNAVNAELPSHFGVSAIVTIQDDEPYVSNVSGRVANEGDDVVFTVELTAPNGASYTGARVKYRTVDGTAKGGTSGCSTCDFVRKTDTITFSSSRTATVRVPTVRDGTAEVLETFQLRLTADPDSPVALALADDRATGTINDTDDRVVSLNVQGASAGSGASRTVDEGVLVPVEVRLNVPSDEDVTGTIELVSGTATFGGKCVTDYGLGLAYHPSTAYAYVFEQGIKELSASQEWTISAGNTSFSTSITVLKDGIDELNEAFRVRLVSVNGAKIGPDSSVSITIRDLDEQPTLAIADTAVVEGDTAVIGLFYQSGNQYSWGQFCASALGATVVATAKDGSALGGTHYTASSETLVYGPMVYSESLGHSVLTRWDKFEVETLSDGVSSGDRVFEVELSNPQNAILGRSVGRVRIIEGDCVDPTAADFVPPTLGIASASADEGEGLPFTVSVSKPFCSDVATAVSVSVALDSEGSDGASSDDVNTPSGTVGFKAGETTAKYSGARSFEDSLDEPDETVKATASWHPSLNVGATYSALSVSATGTILDDDPEPSLEIIDATATEAGELKFIVTLDAPSGKQVTVDYATARGVGTATVVDDYTAVDGTLTFEPGQTTKQVVVQSLADALDEHDETFQLKLADPTNATIDDAIGVGTIEDDDPLPVVSIETSVSAKEGDEIQLTITLSPVSGRSVTVVYATADDDSEGANQAISVSDTPAEIDYTAKTATATIPAGNTTSTIEIEVAADTDPEPDETFLVKLLEANPDNSLQKTTHATIHATDHTATATITNDDE